MKPKFQIIKVLCVCVVISIFWKSLHLLAQDSSITSSKRNYSNIVVLRNAKEMLSLEELLNKSWQEMEKLGATGKLDDYSIGVYLLPCDSVEATNALGRNVPDGSRFFFEIGQRIGRPVYMVFVDKDGKLTVRKSLAVEGEL